MNASTGARMRGTQLSRDGLWTLLLNILSKTQPLSIILVGSISGGVRDLGLLTAVVAAAYLGYGLADFGFASDAGRYLAATPGRESFDYALRQVLWRSALAATIADGSLWLSIGRKSAELDKAYYILCGLMSASMAASFLAASLINGLSQFRFTSLSIGLARATAAPAAVLLAAVGADLKYCLVIYCLGEASAATILLTRSLRLRRELPLLGAQGKLGRQYLWLGIGGCINIIVNRSDVLLVGAVASPTILGIYSIASQLQNAVGTLALSASGPLSVHVARAWKRRDFDQIRTDVAASRRTTLITSVVLAGATIALYVGYISYMDPSGPIDEAANQLAVALAIISAIPAALSGVFLGMALGMQRQKVLGITRLISAACCIPAFWLLTPLMGVIGAAIACIIRDGSLVLIAAAWSGPSSLHKLSYRGTDHAATSS